MDIERWRRVKEVFAGALELSPDLREPWLSGLAEEPALIEEVRSLLAAYEGADAFLDDGALAVDPALHSQLTTAVEGLRIGPYRVLSELGRGGMGAVYLAVRDDAAFPQRVALKLIKRGMDTDAIVRRFVHERRILSGLSHPNIARLFDGGSAEDGRPFFVMEHVEGRLITAFAEERKLSVEARLWLFLKVCSAVQHAHQSLIVHRDLKPANILVGDDGEPKLLDFGIAKLLEPGDAGELSAMTGFEQKPMTPDYASPEQLAQGPVTTATDVYGLGLLLYELLVGQSPAATGRELGTGWASRPPSQAARALATARGSGDRRLPRQLRGDLDTIVGKALESDPARRYGTAASLAEDLERHLDQRPVLARRPTVTYRLGRAFVRHKLAAAFALSVIAFAALAAGQALELARQRDRVEVQRTRVEAQRNRAEALAQFLKDLFRISDPGQSRGRTVTAREILDVGARRLLDPGDASSPASFFRRFEKDPVTRSEMLREIGDVYYSLGLYAEAQRMLENAYALASRVPGREAQIAAAEALTRMGNVALRQSQYAKGQSLYRQALGWKRRLLGPRALSTVQDLNGLGRIATEAGHLKEAEKRLEEALALARAAGPEGERSLAEALFHRGHLAFLVPKSEEAKSYYQEAVRLFSRIAGADHPDTLAARSELASVLFARGDYPEAELRYGEILAARRRLLGPDHPDIATTLSSLAVVQQILGHLAEAQASLEESLAMRRRLHLAADSDEAMTLNNLAAVLLKKGDLAAAEAVFEQAHQLFRRLLGDDDPEVANVLNGLAQVRLGLGDLPQAERLARRSLSLYEAAHGPVHLQVAASWLVLARVQHQAHRLPEAEEAYRRSLAIRRLALPPHHPSVAPPLLGLGRLLLEAGRGNDAEPLLAEALAIRRQARPPDEEKIAEAQGQLGSCYLFLGRREPARALLLASHQTLLRLRGPHDPETVRAARRLAEVSPP